MRSLRFAVPLALVAGAIAVACGSSSRVRSVEEADAGPDGGLQDAGYGAGGKGTGGAPGTPDATPGAGGTALAEASTDGGATAPADASQDAASPVDTDSGYPPLGEFCEFADPDMETYVRYALSDLPIDGGVPSGPIPVALAARVTSLDIECDCPTLPDLSGIRCLQGLENITFDAEYPGLEELATLPNLTAITFKYLDHVPQAVSLLRHLTTLKMSTAGVTDLSALEGLTTLTDLDLGNLSLTDLSSLAGLTSLTRLNLAGNLYLTDISPLAGLTNLTDLDIGNTSIADIGPLANLTALVKLTASQDKFTDLGPLQGLTNLSYLNIDGTTNFTDFSPLVNNAGIGAGDTLYLRASPADCALIKTDLATLAARGATIGGVPTCP